MTEAGRHVDTVDNDKISNKDRDDSDSETSGGEFGDFETEEEIVAKALAEASLDRTTGLEPQSSEGEHDTGNGDTGNEPERNGVPNPLADNTDTRSPVESEPAVDPDAPFSFPSLPTHVPQEEAEPIDEDLQQRMNMLLGLSGPTAKPGQPVKPLLPDAPKREVGQGWNLPGYNDTRDGDIDSWCCEFPIGLSASRLNF